MGDLLIVVCEIQVMQTSILSIIYAILLFGGVLACMRIGWQVGRERLRSLGEDGQAGLGTIDGAIFGLMGLLIAFTFTSAATASTRDAAL